MNSIDTVLLELKSRGFKTTQYRTAILDTFFKKSSPMSVSEIILILFESGFQPNKTTIYRELKFLVSQKFLVELDLGDEKKRYELAHLGHHHHLICTRCHSIEDVMFEEDLSKIETRVAREQNFKVIDHTLELFGICSKCK